MTKYLLTAFFLFFFILKPKAQIDTTFWFVAPHVPLSVGVNSVSFQFSAYSQSVSLRVRQPANLAGVNLTFTLAANSSTVINLTPFQGLITSTLANIADNKGLYISSTDLVSVNYITSSNVGQESISLKGANACGDDFYTPFPNDQMGLSTGTTVGSVGFDIVATRSGTTTIVITPRGHLIGPRQKNITFVTLLNQGETFSCREGLRPDNIPRSVVAQDFNNDLIPDIAIVDQQYNLVFVFLNDGAGNFMEVGNYSLGINPTKIIAADVNSDLNQDLIITNSGSNTVFVYLGNGNGTFTGPGSFATGSSPVSVACADVNADTNKDLVVANNGGNNIRILTGTGSGSFTTYTTLTVGTQPSDIAIGDFNNNGIPDIAVTNNGSNNVSILLGTATAGSFAAAVNYGVGTNPAALTLADFNLDGRMDIATANRGSNNVSVLRCSPVGTFSAATNFAVGTNPVSIVSATIDAGARPDIAVANYGSNNISVLTSAGSVSGTAVSFTTVLNTAAGMNPFSIATADFNGDLQADFVTANFSASNYSKFFGNGSNTLAPGPATNTIYGITKPALITELAGSIVSADKDVAVTINGAVMPTTLCTTYYADQITNSTKIGKNYVVNQGNGSSDVSYLLATVNSTSLNINSSTNINWLINSGETYTVNTSAALSYIEADRPLYLLNMSGNGCKMGAAQLGQAYCAGSYSVGFTRENADPFELQINTRNGSQNSFTLMINSTTTTLSPSDFTVVPGSNNDLVSAKISYSTTDIAPGAYCILKNSADIFGLSIKNGSSGNGTQFSHLTNFAISPFAIANPVSTATICSNTQFTLNGVVGGGPITGVWSSNGFGSFLGGVSQLTNNVYVPNPVDTNIVPVKIVLTSTGICPNKTDTLKLTVKQAPIVSAGLSQVVCSNNPTVQLSGQVYGATNQGVWNVVAPGNGTFLPGVNSFTPVYNLSLTDTALAQLKFVLTSTNNAGCNPVWDTVRITMNKAPIVTASLIDPILRCTNNSTVFLSGTVSGTTTSTGKWGSSTGTGIFVPNNLSLINNYIPSPADLQSGSIYLKLESTNNQFCNPVLDSVQVIFTQPSTPNAGVDLNSCKNNAVAYLNGVITGTSTSTAEWQGGTGVFVPSNAALTATYFASPSEVAAGFVILTFSTTNNGLCLGELDRLKITFQDKPSANFTVNTVCFNDVTLFTDLSLNTSGLGSLNGWAWDLGDGTTTSTIEPIHTYSTSGTFTTTLIVKNSFDCYDTVSRPVVVHGVPTASIEVSRACNGSAQLITFTDRSSISPPDNIPQTGYYWDFGGQGFSTTRDTAFIFPSEGIYGITHIVTSENNCKSFVTQSLNITPKPVARFKIVNNSTLGLGANIAFLDSSNIVPASWQWDLGNGQTSNVKNPIGTYTTNGTYTVSLTIADQFGCTSMFTSTVTIRSIASEITQLIPNVITPNGDSKNDIWRLDFIDVFFPKAEIEIYSRWGERIFRSEGYSNAWDGSYKGDPLPVGAYFYIIKLNNTDNEIFKGTVTLLK